eukprot:4886146-Pyramimonas_sp.AAC.1
MSKLDRVSMKAIIDTGNAIVWEAECAKHSSESLCCCPIPRRPATMHLAGLPCWDFSSQGARAGESGKTALACSAWYAQRVATQEPVIVLEQVVHYPTEIAEFFLGKFYLIFQVVSDPVDLGWPVRRKRKIIVMVHRRYLIAAHEPAPGFCSWPDFYTACFRTCLVTWRDWLLAPAGDVSDDLRWARGRPSSMHGYKGSLRDIGDAEFDCNHQLADECDQLRRASPYAEALSAWEIKNLNAYLRKFPGRPGSRMAFMLQQSADRHAHASSHDNMCTIISNSTIIYSPDHGRSLTPSEILWFQGFPVGHAKPYGERSCFDVLDLDHCFRTRSSVISQAGNAMHCHVIGLAIMWAMMFHEIGRDFDTGAPEGLGGQCPDGSGSVDSIASVGRRLRRRTSS